MPLRVLFLADTHLGYDLPMRPRVRRRRRGHDFMANYLRTLAPARAGAVDLVVHGGDVFDRPSVPDTLVYQAFEPLRLLGAAGVPVFVVPGNHERSRIPAARFSRHPGVHVFDGPRTYRLTCGGVSVAVAGFPYHRRDVRSSFPALVRRTGLGSEEADVALLCMHHCVEGATVGPADYTFRSAPDVVRGADVPSGLAALLTGHVHRHQVLTTDLKGRPLGAPVLYPGSVERTAFAERDEPKGYLLLEAEARAAGAGGRLRRWTFHELPARPMLQRDLDAAGLGAAGLEARIRRLVDQAPANAVLRIQLRGPVPAGVGAVLGAARLRALAPAEMNLEVRAADGSRAPRGRRPSRAPASPEDHAPAQCLLDLVPAEGNVLPRVAAPPPRG